MLGILADEMGLGKTGLFHVDIHHANGSANNFILSVHGASIEHLRSVFGGRSAVGVEQLAQ
jgi:hypothetical protein